MGEKIWYGQQKKGYKYFENDFLDFDVEPSPPNNQVSENVCTDDEPGRNQ